MAEKYLRQACYPDFFPTVTAIEVMFFLEISTVLGYITPSPEIVDQRSGDLKIMPLAINGNRFAFLVCSKISSTGFLCQQTKKIGDH